jgi:hypothetical protein
MLVLIRELLFVREEPQSVLHLARIRDAARPLLVAGAFPRWAREQGIVVRASNGQESWTWPNDSEWALSSVDGVYGRTANLVLVDEVWDITSRHYYEGVQPTMAARRNAQVVFFSAAHRQATELMPTMIHRARGGRAGYALFDWGALPGEDVHDPAVWRLMGPHWDRNREMAVADAADSAAFEQQWANRWPDLSKMLVTRERAMPGFDRLPVAGPLPPRGGIVAIDESRDGSRFARVVLMGDSFWYDESPTVEALVPRANMADHVIVGLSIEQVAVKAGLRHKPHKYGARETGASTPMMMLKVREGRIAHNHSPSAMSQAAGMVVREAESGKVLSARDSSDDILVGKLLGWCLLLGRGVTGTRPMVYS